MKARKINRPTRYPVAWSSVSTGIGESVLDWKLREQRMSEMNERLNDGGQRFKNWLRDHRLDQGEQRVRSNWFTRVLVMRLESSV